MLCVKIPWVEAEGKALNLRRMQLGGFGSLMGWGIELSVWFCDLYLICKQIIAHARFCTKSYKNKTTLILESKQEF